MPVPRAGRGGEPPLSDLVRGLLHDLPGLFGDRVHLLALELRRARRSLAELLLWATMAAVVALTSWLGLCAAAAVALVQAGLAWGWALLAVVAVNLLIAAIALARCRTLSNDLALPATMRQLRFDSHAATSASSPSTDHDQRPIA